MRIARKSLESEEGTLLYVYLDKNASLRVLKVIESYVKIIKEATWQKRDNSS